MQPLAKGLIGGIGVVPSASLWPSNCYGVSGIMTDHHTPPPRRPLNENQRPLWIIIFAILLASIALRTKGQGISVTSPPPATSPDPSLSPSEADLYTEMRIGDRVVRVKRASAAQASAGQQGQATPARRRRPQSAFVTAEIAQFDSDVDPDGWLASVMLIGSDDQPVVVRRATARFELTPRLPTHDFTGYVDANVKPIQWNVPLKFADDAVATVRLPLRDPIAPLIGWPATSHPAVGRAGGFHASRRGIIRHTATAFQDRTVLTASPSRQGARSVIGMASFGQLKIRVSVPGEGVFDAVTPIALRPSVLVDTRWPYQ
ncbi:hypothetical protein Enr13x_32050 [Stieleria neptunia]|uniref:Uncharacterized protein n=1 Tax=Stieleria neptunia TaxID=2527979 RepID=A0A518HR78_9BACT|nr:hypothetical protein [Stieleria neptunia]QDV43349.1 hypothetical protein Enr13x_32050 [Stieleria neptunia]